MSENRAKNGAADQPRFKIWILLDRSGSMQPLREAVVAGTNQFLSKQAPAGKRCRVSLIQFDSQEPFELIVDALPINRVRELTAADYAPRGATPLYDAIGVLISRADQRIHKRQRRERKPEEQIVMIFTDGLENASTDHDQQSIFKLITERQRSGWDFVFLGANQDSYATSRRLGIDSGGVQNFAASHAGVGAAFASVSRGLGHRMAMSPTAAADERADFFDGVREAEEQLEREQRQRSPRRGRRPTRSAG